MRVCFRNVCVPIWAVLGPEERTKDSMYKFILKSKFNYPAIQNLRPRCLSLNIIYGGKKIEKTKMFQNKPKKKKKFRLQRNWNLLFVSNLMQGYYRHLNFGGLKRQTYSICVLKKKDHFWNIPLKLLYLRVCYLNVYPVGGGV